MHRILFCVAFALFICPGALDLDPDNPDHRRISNELDAEYRGEEWYDKVMRPIIHGTYHTGRFMNSGNKEEWSRAKDQYSKFGTGQTNSEYWRGNKNDLPPRANANKKT